MWVAVNRLNAAIIMSNVRRFGFDMVSLNKDLLLKNDKIINMGLALFRFELLTGISGLSLDACYPLCKQHNKEGIAISFILRSHLIIHKKAGGRLKDLDNSGHLLR